MKKDKWCLIIVLVCACPSLHANRGRSFVQPKGESGIYFLFPTFISYAADNTYISVAFCCAGFGPRYCRVFYWHAEKRE